MDELYTRISKSTKHVLYQYMKDNDISLLNYNFNYFFQYCIQKYQIQVISHHFSNHKIEGLTVIDELGISFSYEKDNPIVYQKSTIVMILSIRYKIVSKFQNRLYFFVFWTFYGNIILVKIVKLSKQLRPILKGITLLFIVCFMILENKL